VSAKLKLYSLDDLLRLLFTQSTLLAFRNTATVFFAGIFLENI